MTSLIKPSSWLLAVKRPNVMASMCALVIAAGAGFGFSRDVHLTNAWNGWAPPTLVWASDPSTKIIDKDYLSYQNLHIGNSIIMWVYPLSYRLLGVDPTAVQRAVIYASCLAFALAVVFLVRSFIPSSPSLIAVGAVALAILTTTVDGDLARFGQGNFALGQYYGFAVALQMVVAGLAIRGEIVKCGFGLALLLWMHPLIAGMTALVAGAVLIVPRPAWKAWRNYLFALVLVVCSAAVYLTTMREGISAGSRMTFYEWIEWVRFSNYHWFPFQLGAFTWDNGRRIIPLLSIMLLALVGGGEITLNADRVFRWIVAVFACVLLVLIGLLNSLSPLSMFLTMASLHRASGLLLLLALPFACLCLYNAIKDGGLRGVLAVVVTVTPFLGVHGFPLLPSLALFVMKQPLLVSLSRKWRRVVGVWGFLLAGLAAADILWLTLGLGVSLIAPSLIGSHVAWIVGVVFGIISVAAKSMPPAWVFARKAPFYAFSATFVVLIALQIRHNWMVHPQVGNRQLAKDYLEVQKWAEFNTPAGSLFMTDPTHCYGWKDYSARPSWGNFRDWIHSSIVYHADAKLFSEGLRRARRLGVDPKAYLDRAKASGDLTVSGKSYADLASALKTSFYSLNSETLRQLAKAEKIDYFVFEKESAPKLNIAPQFANASFIVYSAR